VPVHLLASGASGIRDHVRVAAVGLSLTRIQIRRSAHHQTRNVCHRHTLLAGYRQSELGDRAGLVYSQRRHPVAGGPFQDRFQGGLVVAQRDREKPVAVIVEDFGEVLFLADVQPDPHVYLFRRCQPLFPPRLSPVCTCSGRPPIGALAVIHLTNQRSSRMSPSEVHAPTAPVATPPRPSTAAGGDKPYRHRRTSQPQDSYLPGPAEDGKGTDWAAR